jgi:hypothetical protein
MAYLDEEKIDKKYLVPLTGIYNKLVFICPECDNDMLDYLDNWTFGFCDTDWGMMRLVECSKCGARFYSHSRGGHFYFLDVVEEGTNKFYKKTIE